MEFFWFSEGHPAAGAIEASCSLAIEWTERDYIDSIQENACWKVKKCTEDRENLMAS